MRRCIECMFVGFMSGDLVCKRNAPSAFVEACPDPGCNDFVVHTIQPSVTADETCGDYEPAPMGHMLRTRRTYEAILEAEEQETRTMLEDFEGNVVNLHSSKPRGSA